MDMDSLMPVEALPPPAVSGSWWRPVLLSYILMAVAFGGVGGWAVVAKLDAAAVAPGLVMAQTNKKTVQHLEGGIVRDLLVRDGDLVHEGQVLFRLDGTQASADLGLVRDQRAAALAREARLLAERDHSPEIRYPKEVLERGGEALVAKSIIDENANFEERRAALKADLDAGYAKIAQLQQAIEGARRIAEADQKQVVWIDQELSGIRKLFEQGLSTIAQLAALEREHARLLGEIGKAQSDQAQAKQAVAEAVFQTEKIERDFQEKVASDIVDVRKTLAELAQKERVAQDILNRLEIRAPQTGIVQGLKIFTPGAVIRAGDGLLDIAPINDKLVIQAKVRPDDMDVVHDGLRAEIRFPAFHTRRVPAMFGTVRSLSYDRLIAEDTKSPYFEAEIAVDTQTIPTEIRTKLKPGLPADVLIVTGERTVLDYFLAPLLDRLRKVMRDRGPMA